jgi:hypothetical protein
MAKRVVAGPDDQDDVTVQRSSSCCLESDLS